MIFWQIWLMQPMRAFVKTCGWSDYGVMIRRHLISPYCS